MAVHILIDGHRPQLHDQGYVCSCGLIAPFSEGSDSEAVKRFAFDIVVTECGLDPDDPNDHAEASERVAAWVQHWDTIYDH